ncbi:MAG: hypothetical protein ABW007_05755, partial [Chitinophagaceae bacterium]
MLKRVLHWLTAFLIFTFGFLLVAALLNALNFIIFIAKCPTLTALSISRKILKIIAIAVCFVVGTLLCFHFWFINHAEDLIAELVRVESGGKIELKVEKFRYHWLKKRIELKKAVFYTTDSSSI